MGPGEHRPHDEQYWTPPWSTALFAGDLFEAIPFGDQPTTLFRADDGKHFVGEVGFAYGLLTTPTCDMAEQRGESVTAHPFRVLVPVLPLAAVAEQAGAVMDSVKLLRSRDTLHPYMYLPPLPGLLEEESVACLFRPSLVSDELLAEPPRRVAQLQPEARRPSRSSSRPTGAGSPSTPKSCRYRSATRRICVPSTGPRAATTIRGP